MTNGFIKGSKDRNFNEGVQNDQHLFSKEFEGSKVHKPLKFNFLKTLWIKKVLSSKISRTLWRSLRTPRTPRTHQEHLFNLSKNQLGKDENKSIFSTKIDFRDKNWIKQHTNWFQNHIWTVIPKIKQCFWWSTVIRRVNSIRSMNSVRTVNSVLQQNADFLQKSQQKSQSYEDNHSRCKKNINRRIINSFPYLDLRNLKISRKHTLSPRTHSENQQLFCSISGHFQW